MPRKEALTSRERVRLALLHQETDRIPIAMVCSGINPPAYKEFDAHLRREIEINAESYLKPLIDIHDVAPRYCGPKLVTGEDIWGVRRKAFSYGTGEYDEIEVYPLAGAQNLSDLQRHRWPDTKWFDYDSLKDRIASVREDGDPCLMVTNGNIFESTWYMRGFEQIFIDFIENPELAQAILERVTDFYVEHFSKMLAASHGQVDLAFTADDIAGQNGLLMSMAMWEKFIKPCHTRLNKAIHEFGVKVIYHSDGAVLKAVGGLIDMGIDVLQALQFSAQGWNPDILKSQYGNRLSFEGGVSVQTTLPFGTTEEVSQETRDLIQILGHGGGYILGPSHSIQAGTPPENILAMFETARDYYLF